MDKKMNQPTQYQMTSADPDRHIIPVARSISDEFAGGKFVDEISQKYLNNCHYDWNTSRLIWDGDLVIHHWGVWGYFMRLEKLKLKVAGIGAVTTREPYRKQGLMALAAQDSFDAMKETGYHLSILRGRHYVKFGYARAWNYVTYKLTAEEIPDFELKSPYQPIGEEYLDQIISLYNQSHTNYTGTAIRPTYRTMDQDGKKQFWGWFTGDGSLSGYLRAIPTDDNKILQCLEASGDPVQIIAVLKDLFLKGKYEILNFFTLHHQHPVLKILRKGACLVEERFFDNTGWRVKIINLPSTLEVMKPLFEGRLENSNLNTWKGQLHVDAGAQKANLSIQAGVIRVQESSFSDHNLHGGVAIGRFIIGSDEPQEIIQQEAVRCTGDGAELARVLFPNLHPTLSHWDEF
jgi:hypothetical protein